MTENFMHGFMVKKFARSFLYLYLRFALFWPKIIGAKAAFKVLVKFTPSVCPRKETAIVNNLSLQSENNRQNIGLNVCIFADVNNTLYI
jgi:hypothetical protein